MKHYETSQAIAQQWRTEKFRERIGKPISKGVFHEASMLGIDRLRLKRSTGVGELT